MDEWSLRYYDQHGKHHELGADLANPPAYMQATHRPTGKELRYYAKGEPERRICKRTCEECAIPSLTAALKDAVQVEQRCQLLEQEAKDLLSCVSRWAPRGVYFRFSGELEALGVILDD